MKGRGTADTVGGAKNSVGTDRAAVFVSTSISRVIKSSHFVTSPASVCDLSRWSSPDPVRLPEILSAAGRSPIRSTAAGGRHTTPGSLGRRTQHTRPTAFSSSWCRRRRHCLTESQSLVVHLNPRIELYRRSILPASVSTFDGLPNLSFKIRVALDKRTV